MGARRGTSGVVAAASRALIGVAALAVVVLTATARLHPAFGPSAAGFFLLAGRLTLSEVRPLRYVGSRDGVDLTISWTFAFALVLYAPAAALLAMIVAGAVGGASRRQPWRHAALSTAKMLVALSA